MSKILNFSIFGKENSGKCSLNKAINLFIKDLSHPKDFVYKETKYHIFPIPCCGQDLKDNFDISIKNSDFILITLDSNTINDINQDIYYYFHLILLSIINGIRTIIFVITKSINEEGTIIIDDTKIEKIKKFMGDIYSNIKIKLGMNNFNINFEYCAIDSLEGKGIEELLNKFPKKPNQNSNEINQDLVLLGLYDKYFDKEREEFVITCKIYGESNNKYNIEINNTKLNICYIDDKTGIMKQINSLTPFKLGLADGQYVEKLNEINDQFISIKFKLDSIEESFLNNPIKNCFLSFKENNDNICFFDTCEADIIISSFLSEDELKEKAFTVLTKGCKCLFSSYNADIECTIISILGEYENNSNNLIKKKIIPCQKGIFAKILINLSKPILATKFDICNKYGSFSLIKQGEIFALGKINKYKPLKK
jgi:hypothetical protein